MHDNENICILWLPNFLCRMQQWRRCPRVLVFDEEAFKEELKTDDVGMVQAWVWVGQKLLNQLNSLTAIDGHDHQPFDKILWGVVTSTFFVCC